MHIDNIEVFQVALPLRNPSASPVGSTDTLQTVLVRMQSGDVSGWGEATPGQAPLTSEEWTSGVFQCIRDWLAPALVGATVDSGEQLQQRLAAFRANRFAKAALDMAWWDLEARRQGQPLHQLLGAQRDAVEVGPTFDRRETIDELLEEMARAVQAGFARIGLKFRPGWDVQMVNFVRHEFPVEDVHIECECALRLDHMEMLCRLDDFHLTMIDQPLPPYDLVGHAMVQEAVRTPICLGEGVGTVELADIALELHSCKFVRVEPGRSGGLTPALAIHNLCHDKCTPCWVGGTPQSAIGARAALALAAQANFSYPADYFATDQLFQHDLAAPAAPVRDEADGKQRVRLWPEPGIGVQPDAALLERCCLARAACAGS
jgi:o-succinylbenzoate synthase